MTHSFVDVETIPLAWVSEIPALEHAYVDILNNLTNEQDIRPKRGLWFEALRRVAPSQVNVVIVGQDPYHGENKGIQQAHGLSFSVPVGVRPPPSLRNILTELAEDVGGVSRETGDLSAWADQGVLLLNAALTTRGGQAGAHKRLWQPFTSLVMQYLGQQTRPMVFILWGADAQKYQSMLASHHVVIASVHPSPLSSYRGFFGSKPFSRCNAALQAMGREAIQW